MDTYIWQQPDWPHFTYDAHSLLSSINEIAHAQGRLETLLC
ncbi:DUF4172 domain-containing protein [Sphaerochaeta sp. UBA5849]|jgi:Fic family protein